MSARVGAERRLPPRRFLATWRLVFLFGAAALIAARAPAQESCADCHDDVRVTSPPHAELACADCHDGISGYPHPDPLPKVDCSSCHGEPAEQLAASTHHNGVDNGDAPHCQTCHGKAHEILPSSDANSPTARRNLATTCAVCHSDPEFVARHQIPFAKPVEAYRLSVHGRAVERGDERAPSCAQCHGSHAILPGNRPESPVSRGRIAETCGACHGEIAKTYATSVHGQAAARGVRDAPVCTDCHGEHDILAPSEPGSLVNPARVSTATCGRCHSDERLTRRYALPLDKVPAFEDSFHGLALRAGQPTVANCASCHGVHNILPSSDPRSTVNAANLGKTCGACHPGAGSSFAIGPVHVSRASASEHPTVRAIRWFYWLVIPLALGFMVLHNAADFFRKLLRGGPRSRSGGELPRMNLHFRIAHWLVVLSFPVLVVTGFALKFPEAWWARPLLGFESHFAFRGLLHRCAAVLLVGSMVYHLVHLALVPRDRVILRHLWPSPRDLRNLWAALRWSFGRSPDGPTFGKFSYAEKIEYLAFVWGTVLMAVTGALLWFNDFALRFLPKWVSDAATAAHYYEAILATLSIVIWHFYMVIFDPDVYPMDRAWLTGKASADHLRHTRPEYAAQLERELRGPEPETPAGEPDDEGPAAT
jgi:cytochrome b subunit of formate dehydrogenase